MSFFLKNNIGKNTSGTNRKLKLIKAEYTKMLDYENYKPINFDLKRDRLRTEYIEKADYDYCSVYQRRYFNNRSKNWKNKRKKAYKYDKMSFKLLGKINFENMLEEELYFE